MNITFTDRHWHPGIKVSPMEWYRSERNCIAPLDHCVLKHHQSFPATCPPTFPPAPPAWNHVPQAPFAGIFQQSHQVPTSYALVFIPSGAPPPAPTTRWNPESARTSFQHSADMSNHVWVPIPVTGCH